ncbi:MAG: esterase [Planctomycetes bacterium SCN 63-9]|nr:MAG: esterase [Planctomycetes bacterium SCN 63-9]
MTDDRLNAPLTSSASATKPDSLVEVRFIPRQYEPNYAYPLLVLFHGRGANEDQLVRSMPSVSWRNYVALALRGPEEVIKRDRLIGYDWGSAFDRPDSSKSRHHHSRRESEAEIVHKALHDTEPDPLAKLEESIFTAIRRTRRLVHVHSERIFLVGSGEGAAVAYRLGLTYPERFAGVVAINGWLPQGFRPLGRLKDCRQLPVLAVHGAWNSRVPLENAKRDIAGLRAGGLGVAFQAYPSANRPTSPMLADVDTWIMKHCTTETPL